MRLPRQVRNVYDFVKTVFGEYSKDKGYMMAAAVSFYIFLSLIPVLLLAVGIIAFLLGSPERAVSIVQSQLSQYASFGAQGSAGMSQIADSLVRGRAAATGIGLLALLWTGTTVIVTLEEAINVAWNVEDTRSFFKRRLLALGMFAIVGLLFLLSIGITYGINAIKNSHIAIFGTPGHVPVVWQVIAYLVSVFVTVCAFTAIYKFLPKRHVPLRTAFIGGIITAILWELAKWGFNFYVTRFADYSKIYGSLGGIILLLVWINYSATITILGAEATSVLEGEEEQAQKAQ